MKVIAVANQKGGSAKTTTSVNLAAALSEKKKKVLLVDLDPQGSATQWFGIDINNRGLYETLTGNTSITSVIENTCVSGLDIVPASYWLVNAERDLASKIGSERILDRKLKTLPESWDYILIDTPPNLGALSLNALTAAHRVLIPIETRTMPLAGLAQLLDTIKEVKEVLNPGLEIAGIVPCRVDKRTKLSMDVMQELRDQLNGQVYKSFVRENTRLAESFSFQKPITDYASSSIGAKDYREVAKEFIGREGK